VRGLPQHRSLEVVQAVVTLGGVLGLLAGLVLLGGLWLGCRSGACRLRVPGSAAAGLSAQFWLKAMLSNWWMRPKSRVLARFLLMVALVDLKGTIMQSQRYSCEEMLA
jgi:hypothetical protein